MDRDEMRFSRSVVRCASYLLFTFFLLISSPAISTSIDGVISSGPTSVVQSTTLDEAITLYRQGDFENSYQALLILSREDNARAYFLLGKMYERGDGVYRDESKAILYYQKADFLGLGDAGQRIDQLRDGENSVVLDWYLESAWDGDIESVFNLGYLYESGMGVRIDESLALQWYEEAASQQHADAQLRLGLMLVAGAGVEVDVNSGKQWIVKAAGNGNKIAQTIEILFIKNNKNLDIVKTIRGLRTLEHTDEDIMMEVLMSSVARISQPTSLRLLNENASSRNDLLMDGASVIAGVTAGNENKSISQNKIASSNIEQANLIYWVLLAIFLTGIFTTLVHYVIQKRFRESSWEGKEQLVLPEIKMSSSDHEFLRNLWRKDKEISLPAEFLNNKLNKRERHADELSIVVESESESVVSLLERESPKVVVEANVERNFNISYGDLSSKYTFDLKISQHDISFGQLLPEMDVSYVKATPEILPVLEVTQEEMDNIVAENQACSYIEEQAREFEASRINDNDVVSEARLNIGLMFFRGDGVVANIPLAIKWLQRSAELGNYDAEAELKQLYFEYPEYVEVDEEEHRVSA